MTPPLAQVPLPDAQARREIHSRAQAVAQRLRLPFRSRIWRGLSGNWLGAGIGSSIDFQDHRPYLPGDDPRYIDWRAYARTGHYTMKLYREEVSPLVDLVLDTSPSMFFEKEKAARALELLYFCVESALRSGASLRCFTLAGREPSQLPLEHILAHQDLPKHSKTDESNETIAPAVARIPWRQGSLRIFISDLLYPGAPDLLLKSLSASKGRGLIFAPSSAAESAPDWQGNVQFTDCETRRQRIQHVSAPLRERYAQTYARHFALWKEQAHKHDVLLARVPGAPDFQTALRSEALPAGAVELRD
jgi:uncharacterized protein (DUF58 family)